MEKMCNSELINSKRTPDNLGTPCYRKRQRNVSKIRTQLSITTDFRRTENSIRINWWFFVLDDRLISNSKYYTFVCAHLVLFGLYCVISGIPSSYTSLNTSNHHTRDRFSQLDVMIPIKRTIICHDKLSNSKFSVE